MKAGQTVKVIKDTYFYMPIGSIGTIEFVYDEEHGVGVNRLYAIEFQPGETILYRGHELEEIDAGQN